MSSSIDAGYYADQAHKQMEKPCPKSKNGKGKHVIVPVQQNWLKCEKCKENFYLK